jgi:hypothetical protein
MWHGGRGSWKLCLLITPYITSDEKKVITAGWKDEGFRSSNDVSLDWKEQLNYRIVQTLSHNVVSSTPLHERGSNSQL